MNKFIPFKKSEQFIDFTMKTIQHINTYVIPQYGDFPDKTIAKFTPEKIQGRLEAYVDRIGKSSRGPEDALMDCLKIAHFACYLYCILKYGDAQYQEKDEEEVSREQNKYNRKLIKWVKNHYWDSLEKDKDLILRHL